MKKRYELVIELDDNGVRIICNNDGFNVFELVSLLEIKKNDLIEQYCKNDTFKHHRIVKTDGEQIEIQKGE